MLKEGAVEDHANKEKLAKLLRFATTHGGDEKQDQSLTDYVSRMVEGQEKIYYILADSYATAAASPHLEQLREKGIEVLLLTDRIDPWLTDALVEFDGKPLQDVSRAQLDLPDGDSEITQNAMNEEHKSLLKKIKRALKDRVDAVNVSQRLVESAACVVSGEDEMSPQIRRMLEASGQEIPKSKPILEVNISHPLLERMAVEIDDGRFGELSKIVLDHALLAEGSQLDDPAEYVRRMNNLLFELDSKAGAG